MKPFDNKTRYDPGRFRTTLVFYRQGETETEYGGTVRSHTEIKKVKAVDLQIRNNDQLAISAGATVINDDHYFVIRKGFQPEYDMGVKVGDREYTIAAIIPVDIPINYWKILCVRKHDQDTWQG